MVYPQYRYPPFGFLHLACNVLFGRERSFPADGRLCLERMDPPMKILGEENLPGTGPCLITFNHYYRPGFDAWWIAMALAATLPVDIHFVMTSELTWPGKWFAPLGQTASRWLLKRVSKIYGFTSMPPMPPREKDVKARAEAVREYLSYARKHQQSILGLSPEGSDNVPTGALARPAPGAGRFVLLLAELGFPVLPVGVYEENGEFCLQFGRAYRLQVPSSREPVGRDWAAIQIVMTAIAAQLPARLRGVFG